MSSLVLSPFRVVKLNRLRWMALAGQNWPTSSKGGRSGLAVGLDFGAECLIWAIFHLAFAMLFLSKNGPGLRWFLLERRLLLRHATILFYYMSTYTLPDLLKHWQLGELTAEQAVGHLLQNLLAIAQRLTEAEKRLRQLEQPPFQPKP